MLNGIDAPETILPLSAIAQELELTIAAEKALTVGGRVEYTGNGSTGTLVETGLGLGSQGCLLSRVLLDGRETPSLIKTKYLIPSDSVASIPEGIHPLDALEDSLPHEDLVDGMKIPALLRALVVAQIYAARQAERQGNALEQIDRRLIQNGKKLRRIASTLEGVK